VADQGLGDRAETLLHRVPGARPRALTSPRRGGDRPRPQPGAPTPRKRRGSARRVLAYAKICTHARLRASPSNRRPQILPCSARPQARAGASSARATTPTFTTTPGGRGSVGVLPRPGRDLPPLSADGRPRRPTEGGGQTLKLARCVPSWCCVLHEAPALFPPGEHLSDLRSSAFLDSRSGARRLFARRLRDLFLRPRVLSCSAKSAPRVSSVLFRPTGNLPHLLLPPRGLAEHRLSRQLRTRCQGQKNESRPTISVVDTLHVKRCPGCSSARTTTGRHVCRGRRSCCT